MNLSQPLLRGFGRNNPPVESADPGPAQRGLRGPQLQLSSRTSSRWRSSTTTSLLLAQKDTIRNRYTNYLGRVQSTRRLEARAADREQLSDVDQARQAELTAKNNYVNAVAAYRNSLDQFKIKLGLPVGEKLALDDRELDEMEQNGLVPALAGTRMRPIASPSANNCRSSMPSTSSRTPSARCAWPPTSCWPS